MKRLFVLFLLCHTLFNACTKERTNYEFTYQIEDWIKKKEIAESPTIGDNQSNESNTKRE